MDEEPNAIKQYIEGQILGGPRSCSELECPVTFCNCFCHQNKNVMHCMPCCHFLTCSKCGKGVSQATFDIGDFQVKMAETKKRQP